MAQQPTRRTFGKLAIATTVSSGWPPMRAFAQAARFTMRFGSPFPVSHPGASSITSACEAIKKETGGAVEIQIFPNSQLGSEIGMESQVRSGALEFMSTSGVVLQTSVAGINGMPFAFNSYSDVWSAMDGDLGAHIRAAIEKFGIFTFAKSLDNGYRNITTSTRPINTVDDLKGLRIRVPVSPLWVALFRALGASPTPINLNELYSALQTKIVDGQENPLVQIETVKLYEVQKFCSMTGHVWDGNWIIANGKKWASLPNDVQQVVLTNFDAAALRQREDVERLNTELKTTLSTKGLIFNYPDREQFRHVLSKVGFYGEWKKKFGAEAWAKLEKYAGTLGE